VDVVTIAPLPISVAMKTGDLSMDDFCTKKGLIPLTLADGSVYYQPCYSCKNAVVKQLSFGRGARSTTLGSIFNSKVLF